MVLSAQSELKTHPFAIVVTSQMQQIGTCQTCRSIKSGKLEGKKKVLNFNKVMMQAVAGKKQKPKRQALS